MYLPFHAHLNMSNQSSSNSDWKRKKYIYDCCRSLNVRNKQQPNTHIMKHTLKKKNNQKNSKSTKKGKMNENIENSLLFSAFVVKPSKWLTEYWNGLSELREKNISNEKAINHVQFLFEFAFFFFLFFSGFIIFASTKNTYCCLLTRGEKTDCMGFYSN